MIASQMHPMRLLISGHRFPCIEELATNFEAYFAENFFKLPGLQLQQQQQKVVSFLL